MTSDDPENGGLSLNAACLWGQTPASVAGSKSVPSGYHEDCKVRKSFIAELPILQDTWDDVDQAYLVDFSWRYPWDPTLVDTFDPRILSAKASKYNEDNPSWEMAMNGPFSVEYWKACKTELKTLKEDMNVWTLVKRTPDMHVLPDTWAFKYKRTQMERPRNTKQDSVSGVIDKYMELISLKLGPQLYNGQQSDL